MRGWVDAVKAVVKVRPEPGVEVREVDVPRFEAVEVLLELRAAAICGSDLGIYDFTPAYSGMNLPVVLGHEFAGRVAEVGSDVESFEVGDEVLSQSVLACGECGYCRGRLDNPCEDSKLFGINCDGGFAEYVAVPHRLLHRIPEVVSRALYGSL